MLRSANIHDEQKPREPPQWRVMLTRIREQRGQRRKRKPIRSKPCCTGATLTKGRGRSAAGAAAFSTTTRRRVEGRRASGLLRRHREERSDAAIQERLRLHW